MQLFLFSMFLIEVLLGEPQRKNGLLLYLILLEMVLVMLMRMVMPVQYDKDVVLVVYVAFVGNGVKARPSVIRVGYPS